MERLWAPWRLRYVEGDVRHQGCIFCTKPATGDDVAELILLRGRFAYLIMNLFPYNTGHAMAVPFAHVADLAELDQAAAAEMCELVTWLTVAQRRALRCEGFNIGLNLGMVAGAGISDHLHVHIVPRWQGDANFMPILANTMVIPELIPVTYAKLRAELELSAFGRTDDPSVPQAGAIVWLPDEGKVAVRRAADGTLVLPKGHIEPGEAVYRAALRELAEEMGLAGEVIGWGGVLTFTAADRPRRVVYLLIQARPTPLLAQHVGRDTLLLEPQEAIEALTHEDARYLVLEALQRIGVRVTAQP